VIEGRIEKPAKAAQGIDILLGNPTSGVRRHVQVQAGPASDGFEIQIHQIRRRADLVIFIWLVEPVRADGHVGLGGHPILTVLVASGRLRGGPRRAGGRLLVWVARCGSVGRPMRQRGDAALVADPSHIRADAREDRRLRRRFSNKLKGFGPSVIARAVDLPRLARPAIETVAAVRPVEPHQKERPGRVGDFAQLLAVVAHVARPAIFTVPTIPR